jgi:small conductance mechanosensitive channel
MQTLRFFRIFLLLLPALVVPKPGVVFGQERDADQQQGVASETADTTLVELAEARDLLAQLELLADSARWFENQTAEASGDSLTLLLIKGRQRVDLIQDGQAELLERIGELRSADIQSDAIAQAFGSTLVAHYDLLERVVATQQQRASELRDQRSSTPPNELRDLETSIEQAMGKVDTLLLYEERTLGRVDSLGIDVTEQWNSFDHFLRESAESQIGRLQIAVAARQGLGRQIQDSEQAGADESEISASRMLLAIAEGRVAGTASSLEATLDLLDRRGLRTIEYRQEIIRATGEVTGDVLDPRVTVGLLRGAVGDLWRWTRETVPTAFVRLVILLFFVVAFRLLFRLAWWGFLLFRFERVSHLMSDLTGRLLRPTATVLGLLSGLSFLGVHTTTLLAGLGVAGVVAGFALQDLLSNVAAGVSILLDRPYDTDDVIRTAGAYGNVKTMGLINTTIVTFDHRRVLVPNRTIWGQALENLSAEPTRRVDATVSVGFDEDLDRVIGVLRDLLAETEKVLETPEPSVFVAELADSWIVLSVWAWVSSEDWWPFTTELPRLIRLRLADEGIQIPYPRQVFVGSPASPAGLQDV